MISYLKGRVLKKEEENVILEANNVGWLINIGSQAYLVNEDVEIYVHTHVRENDISLWGFRNYDELKMFKMLLDVSGVGPKSAMAIITERGVKHVVNSIINSDAVGLKVSGVGVKTAEKIILDLRDKVNNMMKDQDIMSSDLESKEEVYSKELYNEAFDALESLGYQSQKIKQCLFEILKSDASNIASSQDLIKKALAKL